MLYGRKLTSHSKYTKYLNFNVGGSNNGWRMSAPAPPPDIRQTYHTQTQQPTPGDTLTQHCYCTTCRAVVSNLRFLPDFSGCHVFVFLCSCVIPRFPGFGLVNGTNFTPVTAQLHTMTSMGFQKNINFSCGHLFSPVIVRTGV